MGWGFGSSFQKISICFCALRGQPDPSTLALLSIIHPAFASDDQSFRRPPGSSSDRATGHARCKSCWMCARGCCLSPPAAPCLSS